MAHGVMEKYSKYKRTREIPNKELPMNDINGQFYLDKEIVPVEEYQDGLASKEWNPTQVLYEIASKSQWPRPEFAKTSYTPHPPSFLYSVIVKGVHFVAKTGASTKKVAQHHASSEFLRFLGFNFEFAKMKKKIFPRLEKRCQDYIDREGEMYEVKCHNEERLSYEDRGRSCKMSREHLWRPWEECHNGRRKRCHIEDSFCHEDRVRSCKMSREHLWPWEECHNGRRKRCHIEDSFCHEDRVRSCKISSREHLRF